jgi:6-phosphogluconolactonase (cycloisomerase 2 family)
MITAYSVNATGTLTPLGSTFATGQHSHNLTIDPSNRFIYVASEISNNIFAFTINSTTGALAPIPGSPFGGTSGPLAVAIDQASRFAYVSNSGGEVQAFSIDSMTGALTPLFPTFVFSSGGAYAHSIVFDSTQNFLYTGNINSNNVSAYQVNHMTGVLAVVPGSPFGTGNQPEYVTPHPAAGFLYVTNFGDHNITRFTINPTTGELSLAGVFSDPAATTGAVSGPIALEMTGS